MIKYKDIHIGGVTSAKESLKEIIEIPLYQKEKLVALGVTVPRSVLLRGPPGCGKSTLVKVVAYECGAYLIHIIGPELIGSRPGETEKNLRDVFDRAVSYCAEGPCILFLDEVDSFSGSKSKGGRVLAQLIQLLDKLNELDERLVVVAATNKPDSLSTELRRPGRLEREIFIGIPNQDQREDILKTICSSISLKDIDLGWVAEATPGFVGADLKLLIQQAYYNALEHMCTLPSQDLVILKKDIDYALHNTIASSQKGSDIYVDHKSVEWDHIGGLKMVKEQIKQAIELPIKHPEAFTRLGLPRPKGVLLYGPPGCAKTTLVRAAATSCHVTFLSVSSAQLYSPFVGDSEKKISEIFRQARAGAPCILFLDEIDSLVGSRGQSSKQGGVQERVLSMLLNEMDGIGVRVDVMQSSSSTDVKRIEEGSSAQVTGVNQSMIRKEDNNSVLVVAATNRPDMLDDAILRPGRIDRIIYVPPPDKEARYEIIKVHTQKMAIDSDLDIWNLAERTKHFTGADLENMCREAALYALSVDGLDVDVVQQKHFNKVLETLTPSLTPDQLDRYAAVKFQK